jgi:hypothetical protein
MDRKDNMKAGWSYLTQDELKLIEAKSDQFAETLHRKHGFSKKDAEHICSSLLAKHALQLINS